jgi:ribonuclease HI
MPWQPHKLRDSDVWAKIDERGELVTDKDGRVEVVYKAEHGAKVYRASARNLVKLPGTPVELEAGEAAAPKAAGKPAGKPAELGRLPPGAVAVWTDGACTGNPGPAGLGVVVIEDDQRTELSEYLGEATNNIAELTAIERGLEVVKDRARPVYVHSDSAYAIGLLSKDWKAKANVELVARIRGLLPAFRDLHWVKVPGHAGVPENERCDELAREAILTGARRR